ncbi:AAA family ATPase, partial [Chloroflexota bacterium]
QCIGATTLDDFRKHIERDPALERRFQPVLVEEPSLELTLDILRGIRRSYEEHHRLTITDEALDAAANLASRYIPDRFLPDKAIDLVDEASSRVRILHRAKPVTLKEERLEWEKIRKDKDKALSEQLYDYAAELREREGQIQNKIKELEESWQTEQEQMTPEVKAEDIAEVVSMWMGIPVSQLTEDETGRLLQMEEVLHQRIIGQDEAIDSISKAIRRARAGLKDPRRPIGNFIFLGPTGVGKTELVRALSGFMFNTEDSLIRIDMSEFMEKFAVSRLVGAPPGYVGYDEGGQLTEAVRRKSYCCILLDEIEKAHPDVFNLLLQIFDDGHLTDAKGRRVDFRNSIIIMTSNIGAELIRKGSTLGFASRTDETKTRQQAHERMRDNLLGELKKSFRPEFLNRVDNVVVFHSLNKEQIREIVDLMLKSVTTQLEEKGIRLNVTDSVKDMLGEKGYDEVYGARPLRRVIQNMLEDRLSEQVLRHEFQTFPSVYRLKVTPKDSAIMPDLEKAVGAFLEIKAIEVIKDSLMVYSDASLKLAVMEKVDELAKTAPSGSATTRDAQAPRVEEVIFVSDIVADLKDEEIVIDSRLAFELPRLPVGALPEEG